MHRLLAIAALASVGLALAGCAKKQPTSKPVVVEDVLPFGAPVCFPKGMTNSSSQPGAEPEVTTDQPMSPLKTRDLVPQVFVAPTTQPTRFTEQEVGWVIRHQNDAAGGPISYSFTTAPTMMSSPNVQPTTSASQPTTSATLSHWCALCAAAAERAAEKGRDKSQELSPDTDLLIDFPPR